MYVTYFVQEIFNVLSTASNTSHYTITCILVKGFISSFYFERDITSLRNVQTGCGNHTASQSIGILVLPPWIKRPGRDVTTHHRLAAMLRISGAIFLLPRYAFMDKYTFILYHHYVYQTSNCSVSHISNFFYNTIHNLQNSIKKELSATFFQFISAGSRHVQTLLHIFFVYLSLFLE